MDEWQPIAAAPFHAEVQLAVVNRDGIHMLVFPCRRILRGWINARTDQPVDVHPTHWRKWDDQYGPH